LPLIEGRARALLVLALQSAAMLAAMVPVYLLRW
jgi:hypothetical protein